MKSGVAAALPFAGFLFILPFPGTVAFRLLCLACAFAIACVSWRRWQPPLLPARAAFLAWALIAAAGIFYSFDPRYSAGEWKNEVMYAFMAYAAFFAFARGRRELMLLLTALGAAVIVITAWGAADIWQDGFWREGGGHGGAGALSAYFAAVAPLFAVALVAARDRQRRVWLAAILALVFIAAWAGRQRILWPLFFVEFGLGAVLAHRARLVRLSSRTIWRGAALAALVAVIAFAGLQAWREQSGSTVPIARDSRWTAWPHIVERVMEQPLRGAGLGRQAMRQAYPDLIPAQDPLVWHGHNVFLNAGISMGLPGVIVLLWLFGALVVSYARLLAAAPAEVRWIGVAGILMIVGVVGRNMTNDFFVRDGSLLFWALNGALLGAGLRLSRILPPSPGRLHPGPLPPRRGGGLGRERTVGTSP
jgi:O-antigen ligase